MWRNLVRVGGLPWEDDKWRRQVKTTDGQTKYFRLHWCRFGVKQGQVCQLQRRGPSPPELYQGHLNRVLLLPSRSKGGWRSQGQRTMPACWDAMQHKPSQASLRGRAPRMGALGQAGGGAPQAAKADLGLSVTQPSALLNLGTCLSPWAVAQPWVNRD